MNTKSFRFLWLPTLVAALLLSIAGCSGSNGTSSSTNITNSYAQSLWASRVEYIGDNAAVGSLLSQLGVDNRLGTFTMELQTKAEPYVLTLHFDQTPEDTDIFTDQFHYYADLLLALIKNCSQVDCTYPKADNSSTAALSWTVQNANDTLNLDVKSCIDSADGIQTLLDAIRTKNQDNPNIMTFYSDLENP